ncbi:MAG: acyl-[acyl-carrier-protein]--UDP-N-acetylglucosamine O-acyltransferase, partial [Deltaproteobacteria bacterium]|nr:acyl-[acyl-carrier-protein]--UDP-N-acetylglucosamine O-acyltransferase [Deltaproteobacteria bacterium]
VHIGTEDGGMVTRVGRGCLLMGSTHVAHDCIMGDGIIMANNSALAGHVVIEDHVIMSGQVGVHQFCHVGKHAFLSGGSLVTQDVVPFCVTQGDRAGVVGVNAEGLKRHGFDAERIRAIKGAYRILFRDGRKLEDAVEHLEREVAPSSADVAHMVAFVRASTRGLARARSGA